MSNNNLTFYLKQKGPNMFTITVGMLCCYDLQELLNQ